MVVEVQILVSRDSGVVDLRTDRKVKVLLCSILPCPVVICIGRFPFNGTYDKLLAPMRM